LREGNYPPDPNETSGYTEAPITKRRIWARAYFETACEIGPEIDVRLAQVGLDTYLVEDRYVKGFCEEEIACRLGLAADEVYHRIKSAISYIGSGWDRRWHDTKKRNGMTYKEFKAHKRIKLPLCDTQVSV